MASKDKHHKTDGDRDWRNPCKQKKNGRWRAGGNGGVFLKSTTVAFFASKKGREKRCYCCTPIRRPPGVSTKFGRPSRAVFARSPPICSVRAFSDKPLGNFYSIFELADLVERLLAALGVREAHIFGHAYGSTTAQELLARYGDRRELSCSF